MLICGSVLSAAHSSAGSDYQQTITIDDLVSRVHITTISVSPNGKFVAYLTVKGLPRADVYQVALRLVSAKGTNTSVLLDEYELAPEQAFESDTGVVRPTAGQFAWKSDSGQLAYTVHRGSNMELRTVEIRGNKKRTVLRGFSTIEITSTLPPPNNALNLSTARSSAQPQSENALPTDFALLVRDGYRFYGPLTNPKTRGKLLLQKWKYDWSVIKKIGEGVTSYGEFPQEWEDIKPDVHPEQQSDSVTYTRDESRSPNGDMAAMIEDAIINLRDPTLARRESPIVLKDLRASRPQTRVLAESSVPPSSRSILGWRSDGKELYYLDEGAEYSSLAAVTLESQSREIYKAQAGLSAPSPLFEISHDGHTVVLVRSTNTHPDELLEIDTKTGSSAVLFSPNEKFESRDPVSVRFVRIKCCGGRFYGRLYLPKHHAPGTKYPLVFTNYLSTPGFYASVGDEVPILVLAEHGIAVFALHSSGVNIISRTQDFRFEIGRVSKPLQAMEWVRQELANEGLIDPERCGLTGLSYGAEIAMYAYWRSKMFRAISVASTSWEPMNYYLAGINYSKFLDSRGLSLSDAASSPNWKQLSASLNLGTAMPALLMQSSDMEEYFGNIETWFSIRRGGLPVEWLLYPNEGHVKRSPSNKWWVYRRNLDWFRFWLQDYEDPDPTKAAQYARWRQMRTHVIPGNKQSN